MQYTYPHFDSNSVGEVVGEQYQHLALRHYLDELAKELFREEVELSYEIFLYPTMLAPLKYSVQSVLPLE